MLIKELTLRILTVMSVAIWAAGAVAQQADDTGAAQENLKIYFSTGSSQIEPAQRDMLDQAARLFREGDPFVMIVSGVADTVGDPAKNLSLSLKRATVVADALSARGIPVGRLQVLGRGNSELEVATGDNVPSPDNRVVEITWR